MAKKKSGRELVDKLYRDLERLYPIKIVDGEVDDLAHGEIPEKVYGRLQYGVSVLENTIAKIPVPERPLKARAPKAKAKAPKA